MTMIGFELLFPNVDSGKYAYLLRQDPEVRRQSLTFCHEESFYSFFPRFLATHFTMQELPPLAILYGGERAGLLRFNREEEVGTIEISIVLAKSFRGRGIGVDVLQVVKPYLKSRGIRAVVAKIKSQNIASQKIFEKAGWKLSKREGELAYYNLFLEEGKRAPLFFIAEAGSNWKSFEGKSDLDQAKALIDVAKEAGADAVKFQTFRSKTTYVEKAGQSGYLEGTPEISDLLEKLEMPYEMIPKLAEYAQKVGIEWMSAVFSLQDLSHVDPFVQRHKVASYENNHRILLEALAMTKKPLIISTGATKLDEIRDTVAFLRERGVADITLLQCSAVYPAPASAMNLPVIRTLAEELGCKVGISDHSRDPYAAPLGASMLGASVIEKHFTLSRTLQGPDHRFAIEPLELQQLVTSLREQAEMGKKWQKGVEKEEEELRHFARRGLQAISNIDEGDLFQFGINYEILRPGNFPRGADPKEREAIEGKRALRSIKKGEGIP